MTMCPIFFHKTEYFSILSGKIDEQSFRQLVTLTLNCAE